jgi:hypothetical protein
MHTRVKQPNYRSASVACVLLLIVGLWTGLQPALAQRDDKVEGDVLFLFDTTEGTADVLITAHDIAKDVVNAIADECNPGFAVAQYRDWAPQGDLSWHLVQSVTLDREPVINAINLLFPGSGGDRPDSVGWALHRSLGLNWHEDAVKVIVLIGGAPPHNPDPGADGVYGTDDDLLFADVLSELVAADAQVIAVYIDDSADTMAYWNGLANATLSQDAIRLRFPTELSSVLRNTVCRTIKEAKTGPPPSGAGGSLRGAAFHDVNQNGLWDAGEEGLPGVDVTVYSPSWEGTAYTGNDGTYGVVALGASWWGVRITVPQGWRATTPTDRWGYLITEQGTVYWGLHFGLTPAKIEEAADQETDEVTTGEEAAGEDETIEETPFFLPVTGHMVLLKELWVIAVGIELAAAAILLRP